MKKTVLFLLAIFLLSAGVFHADAAPSSPAPAKTSAPASVYEFKTKLPPLVVPKDEEYHDSRGLLDRLRDSAYTNFVKENRWHYLLDGFITTMLISFCSAILGILIGFIVAVIRSICDQTGRLKLLNLLCKIYLTVIRGTPVVVQLLIIYFVIFGQFGPFGRLRGNRTCSTGCRSIIFPGSRVMSCSARTPFSLYSPFSP